MASDGSPEPAGFPDGYEAAIRDGENLLTSRHAGVPAWFGRATLQWWAIAGQPGAPKLVAADSPQELSRLLDTLQAAGSGNGRHRHRGGTGWPPGTSFADRR